MLWLSFGFMLIATIYIITRLDKIKLKNLRKELETEVVHV
jgi:hypothetical protein